MSKCRSLRTDFIPPRQITLNTFGPRREPCLCELVRSLKELEELVANTTRNRPNEPKEVEKSEKSALVGRLMMELSSDGGQLQAACWKERGMQQKLVPFLYFMAEHFFPFTETSEYQEGLSERYVEWFGLLGSAGILEATREAVCGDQLSWITDQIDIFIGISSSSDHKACFQHVSRQRGDIRFEEGAFNEAIDSYQGCFITSSVGSWCGRLNCAAARLRYANSGSQSHQSVFLSRNLSRILDDTVADAVV